MVCTGNICRSPLAEHLLKKTVDDLALNLSITSAGTGALLRAGPPSQIITQARDWGLDVAAHQPQQISESVINSATLVLTAERSHRSELVALVPRASRKVFTLKQLARIANSMMNDSDPALLASLRSANFETLISEIADYRALTPPPDTPTDDDVPDPYRRSQKDYDQSAEQILLAVNEFRTLLHAIVAE